MFKSIYRKTFHCGTRFKPVKKITGWLLISLLLLPASAQAGTITCAVASNFTNTLREIVTEFEHASGHTVRIVSGSTGKLFAQIIHGAPFDVFLSADTRRPRLLEEQQQSVPGSRFVYARGQLALWSQEFTRTGSSARDILERGSFKRLALANPKTAPYGQAAKEVLSSLDLWNVLKPKMVRGENIGQAFQFTATGNADWGLVALSQVKDPHLKNKGTHFVIAPELYAPLDQEAVLLKRARNRDISRQFLEFLKHKTTVSILHRYGYLTRQ